MKTPIHPKRHGSPSVAVSAAVLDDLFYLHTELIIFHLPRIGSSLHGSSSRHRCCHQQQPIAYSYLRRSASIDHG